MGLFLYELEDQNDLIISNRLIYIPENQPTVSHPSGSKIKNDEIDSSNSQIKLSNHENISQQHFEIEGEAFIVTPQCEDEPKIVCEALSCPTKDKWLKAIEKEMESMKSNNV